MKQKIICLDKDELKHPISSADSHLTYFLSSAVMGPNIFTIGHFSKQM